MSLESPLESVRLSLSSYCELRCSYCDQTGSKKSKAKPTYAPTAQKRIFACNSFYSEDLPQALAHSETALIELHFLTLSLERHKESLQRLSLMGGDWAVIIDHWDTEKIKNLINWDKHVTEYRVIPSERYSSDFFLAQLPPFILRKMKWQFLRKTLISPALPDLGDIFIDQEQLPTTPLHHFAVVDPKWDHTWSDQSIPLVQTERWSAIDAAKYKDSDWPLKLLGVTTPYVGYVSAPQAQEQDLKAPVVYFSTPAHTAFQWVFGITEKPFYFLENFLVRKEIWAMYLRSTSSYNHWTWTAFIKNQNIQVAYVKTPALSQMTPEKLREELKNRCVSTGDKEFYSRHIFNIHPGRFFRQQSYTFFFVFLAIARYWPKYLSGVHQRATNPAVTATQNILHVFSAIYNHIPQWFWDGPWQWFWMKGPWKWIQAFKAGPWKWFCENPVQLFWKGPWKWMQSFKSGPWKWFWEHPVQLFWRGPWQWFWQSGPWRWAQAFKAGPWKWFWEHPVQLFWRGPWEWFWQSGPWRWMQSFKSGPWKWFWEHPVQLFWRGPWEWFWQSGPWRWMQSFKSGPWKWFCENPVQLFWRGPWQWFWKGPWVWFWMGPWAWFWKLHSAIHASLGFIASLFDFPQEIRIYPRPRRWLLQAQFMARKWGWLVLKSVGLR